jgi:drug/metabolite transporter (DMT)-like permease
MNARSLGLGLIPALFVFLWSTGWVAARYVTPYADPLTFLAVRFGLAAVLIGTYALTFGAGLPRDPRFILHALITGALLHGLYLGGVWWAIAHGIPAGLSALIASVQPLLTALLAPRLLGETLTTRRKLGVALGFIGLVIALSPKLAGLGSDHVAGVLGPLAVNLVGMVAVTAGTFWQKRFLQGGDLRTIAALQYCAAFATVAPLALATESLRFEPTPELFFALAWSVLVLSILTIALYLFLIRRGEVSRAAVLIYLVPPVSALQAWALIGEMLTPIQFAGMAVTVAGVALASSRG